ncbi:MAG: hypothetical protein A2Z04_05400 [Chloroflexi bacterium RBG_16_57_9]|nr:MAG: hypothetical protein A2Z04_05400 [Chloroflexi bacterium RBG_16_57_9]
MSDQYGFGLPRFEDLTIATHTSDLADCLGPTDVMDIEHPAIRATVGELTAGVQTPVARTRALFNFVRDRIVYNFGPILESRADWLASTTLARGDGFCQQKATLLATLLRAAGLSSQLVFQDIKDYKLLDTRFAPMVPDGIIRYHGLTAVYLNGRWLRIDATLDAGLSQHRGYNLVEFRPDADALLPATDLQGLPHFDILAETGPFPNLPVPLTDAQLHAAPHWREWQILVRRTGASM